jgi:hypothetical protein
MKKHSRARKKIWILEIKREFLSMIGLLIFLEMVILDADDTHDSSQKKESLFLLMADAALDIEKSGSYSEQGPHHESERILREF